MQKKQQQKQQDLISIFKNGKDIFNKEYKGIDLKKFDMVFDNRQNFTNTFPPMEIFKKKSSSPTNVYRIQIYEKNYYVKMFQIPQSLQEYHTKDNDNGALLYEKEVYRYVRHKSVEDKDLKECVIQMPLSVKDKEANIGYIFTEDTGGEPFYSLFDKRKYTSQILANIYTQLLHCIYVLQRNGIVHNDLHMGNILIVRDNKLPKKYDIFGQEITVYNHPYSLKIYDFDMASITTFPNGGNPFRSESCIEMGRCNNYLSTDLYVWLVHILHACEYFNKDSAYMNLIKTFKMNIKKVGSKRSILKRLMLGNTPQMNAVKNIQKKYSRLYESKNKQEKYLQPIFHASCDYNQSIHKCYGLMYPQLNGSVLASCWADALKVAINNK